MIEAIAQFIKKAKARETAWLCLLGSTGIGKTHLAGKVWDWWIRFGRFYRHETGANLIHRGQYVRWHQFVRECREGDSSREEDMASEKLLILDDIGAGAAEIRAWMADKLYSILNARLEREGLATLVAANLSLEALGELYDPRIASRLIRSGRDKVIEVEATDYALRH